MDQTANITDPDPLPGGTVPWRWDNKENPGATSLALEANQLFSLLNPTLIKGKGLTIQFIGPTEGVGTSTMAREFALASLQHADGGVMLLDFDWKGSGHFHHFNQHKQAQRLGEPGPAQSIGVDPAEIVRMPSSQGPSDPDHDEVSFHRIGETPLLVSHLVNRQAQPTLRNQPEFWRRLRKAATLTVVDSPPANRSSDGLVICGMMDVVILVVEAEHTRVPVIESLKSKLAAQGAAVAGVVFNKRKFYIPKLVYRWL
ncbi:MAG: hypothetical protein HQL50_05575 [Magnetococcales bacterium]|nr:hypothetical protein [Magnetococcales bacterium]